MVVLANTLGNALAAEGITEASPKHPHKLTTVYGVQIIANVTAIESYIHVHTYIHVSINS